MENEQRQIITFKTAEGKEVKYIELSVTYRLYDNEIDAVQELANQNGRTLEDQFELMMTGGSKWDIEKKIGFWQEMGKNKKRKNETVCAGCGKLTDDPMKGPPARPEDEAQDYSLYCPRCHEAGVEAHYGHNK